MSNRDFDFKGMQDKFQKVLGEDFLFEINKFIPKKGPNVDLFETDTHVYVVAELPGISANDHHINIRLDGYKLLMEGVIPFTYPVKELIQSERFIGNFKREINLPNSITGKGVHAAYKKGILAITIPKRKDLVDEDINIEFEEE